MTMDEAGLVIATQASTLPVHASEHLIRGDVVAPWKACRGDC
jgi:hypothetical protein